MTVIGGLRKTKSIILNDIDGNDEFIIKDADRVPVVRITSKGDLKIRGKVTKA